MPSIETKSPATAADNSGVGTLAWTNTGNIFTSDNVRASATFSAGTSVTSHYLEASNFGFTIPADAVVLGFIVEWERARSGTGNSVTDSSIRLMVGGSVTGDNKSAGATWSATEGYVGFGGAADLWGLTPTPAQINASNFGVVLSCACNNTSSGSDSTAHVDHVRITVYYLEFDGPNVATTAAVDTAVGDTFWITPENAKFSDDDYSIIGLSLAEESHYLKLTDFGFAVPTDASSIDGVEVHIERHGDLNDKIVRLVVGGVVSGDNKAVTGDFWPATDETLTYGGPQDDWSLTLTAADVNASDFGCVLQVQRSLGGSSGYVDAVTMTVYYTAGEEESSSSSSSSLSSSVGTSSSSSSSSRGTSSSSSSSSSSVGTSSSSSSSTSVSVSASSESSSSSSSSLEFSSASSSSSSVSSSSSSSRGTSSSSSSSLSTSSSSSASSPSSESSSSSSSLSSSSSSSVGTSSSSSASSSSSLEFSSSSSSSTSSSSSSSTSSSSSSTSSDIEYKPRNRITFILKTGRAIA